MKDTLNAVRVALFFLIGIALLWVVYVTLGQKDLVKEPGYRVVAIFDDMNTLSPEADVRMAGVKIGRVIATDLVKGKGHATLLILNRYADIPADSVATVSMGNLLGQNYVSLEYGNPETGYLKNGSEVATRPGASVAAVLDQINQLGQKLNNLADSFGGAGGEGSPLAKLNEVIETNSSKIEQTLDNLTAITSDLREGRGTLGKLLQTEEAHDAILAASQQIELAARDARTMFGDAQELLSSVRSGEGGLGKLLYDPEIAQRIDLTIGNFQQFSEKLNSGTGTLGLLINDDTLYRDLRSLLSQAEQSLGSMSDSGPITAVGAAAGALF